MATPQLVTLDGTVKAVEDGTVPGGDARIVVVHAALEWKTGQPAGALALQLRSNSAKDHADEIAQWPLGTKVRLKIERTP